MFADIVKAGGEKSLNLEQKGREVEEVERYKERKVDSIELSVCLYVCLADSAGLNQLWCNSCSIRLVQSILLDSAPTKSLFPTFSAVQIK